MPNSTLESLVLARMARQKDWRQRNASNRHDAIKDHLRKSCLQRNLGKPIADQIIGSIRAEHTTYFLRDWVRENISKSLGNVKTPYFHSKDSEIIISQIKNTKGDWLKSSLDLYNVRGDYQVLINDDSVENPFVISRNLAQTINKVASHIPDEEVRAKTIFDWMQKNISYGKSQGCRNSVEVLDNRKGVCGEQAYLYITMARSCNLNSSYVSVTKDCYGKDVHHACAVVETGKRDIYVDPAYYTWDVHHCSTKTLKDEEVIRNFSQWREKL